MASVFSDAFTLKYSPVFCSTRRGPEDNWMCRRTPIRQVGDYYRSSQTRQSEVDHLREGKNQSLQTKQFSQSFGLGPADGNLALLAVVHAQLVGAFEPGDDLADAVDVDHVRAVGAPEHSRI